MSGIATIQTLVDSILLAVPGLTGINIEDGSTGYNDESYYTDQATVTFLGQYTQDELDFVPQVRKLERVVDQIWVREVRPELGLDDYLPDYPQFEITFNRQGFVIETGENPDDDWATFKFKTIEEFKSYAEENL